MPVLRYVEIDPTDGSIQAVMESASVPNANALEATKALIEARGRKMVVLHEDEPLPEPFRDGYNAETKAFESVAVDLVADWTEKYERVQAQLTDLEASRPEGAEIPVDMTPPVERL